MHPLKRSHLLAMVIAPIIVLFSLPTILTWSSVAQAAPAGSTPPAGAYGAVQVLTTATKVPLVPMSTRNAFGIQNLGPNVIYCGWANTVTSSTGWQVAASGGTLSVDVTFNTNTMDPTKDQPYLYCICSVAQVSPADTRYLEVK